MIERTTTYSRDEFLICVLASLLVGVRSVAVGAASPIPAAAALLTAHKSAGKTTAMILGSNSHGPFNDGGPEIFDRAAQGRIDAFFMGGGQIDGAGNINLVGTGEYPRSSTRFPGSFGTPYLYSLIPRVILFREEHSKRVLVPEVDFITAAGNGPAGVHRPGGPYALVTGRALFLYDRNTRHFVLSSLHPGHTLEEIETNTGFVFTTSSALDETPPPSPDALEMLRGPIRNQLKDVYPEFSSRLHS